MDSSLPAPDDVIRFWRDAGAARWFKRDDAFDAEFRDRFLAAHEAAANGQLQNWSETPQGALALVLLLDQFPRNAFRGTPRVYATDVMARDIADAALAAGHDRQVDPELRRFLYIPFMHSERLTDQERSLALNEGEGGEALRWARHHHDVVQRFGRFPHRNTVLGRVSTPEETQFLQEDGFTG
jgi:uncharacterized protein (DUF924 family)